MKTVADIIRANGFESVDDMEVGDHISVDVPGLMELVIEKVLDDTISVAHYWEQNRDLMRDPEIVFQVENGEWTPIEYIQDPRVHRHDPDGLDLGIFPDEWDKTLRDQGFVDAAQEEAADG